MTKRSSLIKGETLYARWEGASLSWDERSLHYIAYRVFLSRGGASFFHPKKALLKSLIKVFVIRKLEVGRSRLCTAQPQYDVRNHQGSNDNLYYLDSN